MTTFLNWLSRDVINDLSSVIQGREDSFAVLTNHLEEKTAQTYKKNRLPGLPASDVKSQIKNIPSLFTGKKSKEALLEELVRKEEALFKNLPRTKEEEEELARNEPEGATTQQKVNSGKELLRYVNERVAAIYNDPAYAQLSRIEIQLAIRNALYC